MTTNEKDFKVVSGGYDFYGDPEYAKKGYITGGLYHYYINRLHLSTASEENSLVIPPTDAVVSVTYMPYVLGADVKEVQFDSNRFANEESLPDGFTFKFKSLYRVTNLPTDEVNVASFDRYKVSGTTIRGNWNWRNEGKLWQYPYTRLEFNDNISSPIEIRQNLFNDLNNTKQLKVRNALNSQGMYLMYCAGYKGDEQGWVEGVVSQGNLLPTTSSYYMEYMSRNQNQFKANRS